MINKAAVRFAEWIQENYWHHHNGKWRQRRDDYRPIGPDRNTNPNSEVFWKYVTTEELYKIFANAQD